MADGRADGLAAGGATSLSELPSPTPVQADRDRQALLALLEASAAEPFGWTKRRCCAGFVEAAVAAQTGVWVFAGFEWRSRRQAMLLAARLGGLVAVMDARFDRIAPALAQRGDVAGLPDEDFGVRLAIVEGAMLAAPGSAGLARLPRCLMSIAWDTGSARVPPSQIGAPS